MAILCLAPSKPRSSKSPKVGIQHLLLHLLQAVLGRDSVRLNRLRLAWEMRPRKLLHCHLGGIVIQELTAQTGTNVVSSFRVVAKWQPTFQLDDKPLPTSASVRVWDKGKGGRVAQSLVHGLILPENIHVLEDEMDESLGRRLQWHTIAVISCPLVLYLLLHTHIRFHTYHCCFIRPRN